MRRRATLLGIALSLAACGRGVTVARVKWHEGGAQKGCVDLPGDHTELGILDLPEVLHDSRIGRTHTRPYSFMANMPEEDTLYFKGNKWGLADRPEDVFGAWRDELRKLMRNAPVVGTPPRPDASLLLRVSAAARWKRVRRVLAFASAPDPGFSRVRFGVGVGGHWAVECSGFLEGEWRAVSEPVPAATVLPVSLERTAGGDRVATKLRAGERSWEFPRQDARETAAVPFLGADLAAANRIWDELEAHLSVSRGLGFRTIGLRIGDEVPWAYVVAVLDAGIGARVFDVRLGDDLALRLAPPEGAPLIFRPGEPEPRDWSTALALSIGIGAAGLAFALGRLPRRKRAQPKPA